MTDIFLDLEDKKEIINFLSHWIDFSDGKIKAIADAFITDYDDGKAVDLAQLQNFVKEFARDVYPARYALENFFEDSGAAKEWAMVEKALRRSTAHLLSRYHNNQEINTLNDLFKDDDFDLSFTDEDRSEILQVRHHVREDYWAANKQSLQAYADEGESVLNNFEDLIFELRDCAENLPALLQEELYAKITKFEDRVLFGGEVLDEEMLKQELAYYKDQAEIPIELNGKPAL